MDRRLEDVAHLERVIFFSRLEKCQVEPYENDEDCIVRYSDPDDPEDRALYIPKEIVPTVVAALQKWVDDAEKAEGPGSPS